MCPPQSERPPLPSDAAVRAGLGSRAPRGSCGRVRLDPGSGRGSKTLQRGVVGQCGFSMPGRSASVGNFHVLLEALIPDADVALVIGSGGSAIRDLEQTFRVSCAVTVRAGHRSSGRSGPPPCPEARHVAVRPGRLVLGAWQGACLAETTTSTPLTPPRCSARTSPCSTGSSCSLLVSMRTRRRHFHASVRRWKVRLPPGRFAGATRRPDRHAASTLTRCGRGTPYCRSWRDRAARAHPTSPPGRDARCVGAHSRCQRRHGRPHRVPVPGDGRRHGDGERRFLARPRLARERRSSPPRSAAAPAQLEGATEAVDAAFRAVVEGLDLHQSAARSSAMVQQAVRSRRGGGRSSSAPAEPHVPREENVHRIQFRAHQLARLRPLVGRIAAAAAATVKVVVRRLCPFT